MQVVSQAGKQIKTEHLGKSENFKCIVRTQSNINGHLRFSAVNVFRKKSFIVVVRLGSKYASELQYSSKR